MNTVAVIIDKQWGIDYLMNQDALDMMYIRYLLEGGDDLLHNLKTHEELEWVQFYYDAAAMYVYWRWIHETSDNKFQQSMQWHNRLIGDILHGQGLTELDHEALVTAWKALFDVAYPALVNIQHYATINHLSFGIDSIPPRTLLVHCTFH